jgi:hypothetical protein
VPRLTSPRELAQSVSKLLADERRRRGTPRGSRALTCFWQAVLGLRWFRDRTSPDALARDHGISRATAYRYVDEVIAVLAGQAPDLRQALERARQEGYPHVILDGTVIPCDRCREKTLSVCGEAELRERQPLKPGNYVSADSVFPIRAQASLFAASNQVGTG